MLAIVCCTSAVDVEAGDNLRDRIIQAEDDLNVASRILRGDGNSILSTNGSNLVEDAVLDALLDLLDLLQGLFLVQAIQEEINITGGGEMLVIIFSEASLVRSPFLGNRKQGGSDGGTGGNDVVPIQVHE